MHMEFSCKQLYSSTCSMYVYPFNRNAHSLVVVGMGILSNSVSHITCMHMKTTCMYIFSTQVCLQSLFLTLIRQLQNICMHVYLICMHMVLINIPKLYLFVYIYPRIYIVYFLDLNPNQLLYLLSGVSYILFDIFIIFELLKNNKNNIILLNIYSSILRRIYIIKKNIQCYAFFLLAVYEKIINQLFQLMHKLILNLIALLFSIEYQITKIMHLI
eukprot:TRINITY_DN8317_c0_g1_i2.p3 TRINITY_DN8317_c0_g1~~TRINITY_DN8317_c0_g1_i2.p3  ORF type:complete len:215 (-),score=-15.32 TRINITY_DN8317_c0_g1_i2:587-1231(-)